DPLGDLEDELADLDDLDRAGDRPKTPLTDSGVHALSDAVAGVMAQSDSQAPRTPPPVGGEFARELRRKMSKMAERLFPQKQGLSAPSIYVGVAHARSTEMARSAIESNEPPGLDDAGPYMEVPGAKTFTEPDEAAGDSWRHAPAQPTAPSASTEP